MTDLLRCALPTPDPELVASAARPRVRAGALAALAAARARPSHAAPVLSAWFREARWLHSRERVAAAELVYGVIRAEGVLRRAGAPSDEALLDGLIALLGGDRLEGLEAGDPVEDYAAALSLPVPVAAEWRARLGDGEAAALGAALSRRAPVTVRANAARCTPARLAACLGEEGVPTTPGAAPLALDLGRRVNVTELGSFRDGWFEVQDAASQRFVLAVLAAAAPLGPEARALDLCAGAGGKSLALAAAGLRVLAHDVRGEALAKLVPRARRAGCRVEIGPPRPAQIVVVDAPCSGTGRLRRDPALRWGLDPGRWPPIQRALLDQAARLVLPGGLLAYATCSLLAAENQHELPGWTLLHEATLWPHRDETDGFGWRIWAAPR